jgi:hypothetical protein
VGRTHKAYCLIAQNFLLIAFVNTDYYYYYYYYCGGGGGGGGSSSSSIFLFEGTK